MVPSAICLNRRKYELDRKNHLVFIVQGHFHDLMSSELFCVNAAKPVAKNMNFLERWKRAIGDKRLARLI